MREPFRIAFRNMAPPFGADDLARDNALELERLTGRNIACRVTIEKRHRRHSRGNLFSVAIELRVSDQLLVVHRDPPEDHTHEGLDGAIADAFGAIRRQLRERGLARGHEMKANSHRVAGEQGYSPASLAEFSEAGSEAAVV
jgi:hypothetical protein